jgi:hypothetical protein
MRNMSNEIIVAGIAFIGTMVGTFGGIMTSSKLTNHRLAELEKKVDKHNSLVERTYRLEEQMSSANHRLDKLGG